jgi:hypothetical protein
MATYYFDLVVTDHVIVDASGMDFPDRGTAVKHARSVAREMMKRDELTRRHWRLRICDEDRVRLDDLLFASADQTLDHLTPHLRRQVEDLCLRYGELTEMLVELRMMISQSRAVLARSARAPFLAAVDGRRVAPIPAEFERRSGFADQSGQPTIAHK